MAFARDLQELKMNQIILTTINAKWIHPSLALRLLKANLGDLEDSCEIIEFALRQPLREKTEPFLAAQAADMSPQILGISVSIWNHLATIELLKELDAVWQANGKKPIIVLGGPEVSHLPLEAEIFNYANYVIRGEGEITFRLLCEDILQGKNNIPNAQKFINGEQNNLEELKSAYHLYTDEDVTRKLIYVESSRGCPFGCDFCLSAHDKKVREFPLDKFFTEMEMLINRGTRTFKFLDRTFNINIERSKKIINFFLLKINSFSALPAPLRERSSQLLVHFEIVPSILPIELLEALTHFPPGTLRLEIGFQTFNTEVAKRINRPSKPGIELAALRYLHENSNAIIHADLIAGLPGEDIESFGKGFDLLWESLRDDGEDVNVESDFEIQLGILKQLPGAPISRHNEEFTMRYSSLPPYEVEETSCLSAEDLKRIKNFARFWELIVNRGLIDHESIELNASESMFEKFMVLADSLLEKFGKNWGIDREELREAVGELLTGKFSY